VGAVDDFELPAAPGTVTRAAAEALSAHRRELLA
jgi:hypothetical protein